jgi:hypothetical protein
MKSTDVLKQIDDIGLHKFGDVYLFGSFAKTDGKEYNDIDLYVDANSTNINEIEKTLSLLPYDYIVVPQYYSPMPKPVPNPPWPPKPTNEKRNNTLHVTVCLTSLAKEQPFYKTMLEGKHFVLKSSEV